MPPILIIPVMSVCYRMKHEKMKIVNDYPPNYEQICEAFPEVRDSPNVVFTYGNELFVPNGSKTISKDLEAHENYHAEQQAITSPEDWWDQYLIDSVFRAEQELGAYKRQYRYARRHYSKVVTKAILDHIATDLSGPMYGSIYIKAHAKRLIREKY